MSDPAASTPDPGPPPDAGALLAALDRPDPFRPTADLELEIPLRALDPAPWNPKKPISGIYRRGLAASLGQFALRDRLKVWPDPRRPGRYLALDGNQRLDVLAEMAEDHAASAEAARRLAAEGTPLDPDSKEGRKRLEAAFKAVLADDAWRLAARAAVHATPIPCRVLAGLPRAEAELFTASFDRNHAAYDEAKLADLADRAKAGLGDLRDSARRRLEAMVRPERPFVPPPEPPRPINPPDSAPAVAASPDGATAAPRVIDPADALDADGDDMPWGPPPPIEAPPPVASRPAEPPLIPVMFSLTAAHHAELTAGLLRSTQRLVRSTRLLEAVRRFTDVRTEADLSEAAAEVALICLERRLAVADDADL